MMKSAPFVAIVLTIAGTSASARPASPPETGEREIAQVVETFRTAIIARDRAALLDLSATPVISFLQAADPETLARARTRRPAATRTTASSYAGFVDDVTSGTVRMEETFSDLVVHADGTVGTVWFAYVFEEGGKATNSGHETWSMVNTDRGWKIGSIVYSVTDAPAAAPPPM